MSATCSPAVRIALRNDQARCEAPITKGLVWSAIAEGGARTIDEIAECLVGDAGLMSRHDVDGFEAAAAELVRLGEEELGAVLLGLLAAEDEAAR